MKQKSAARWLQTAGSLGLRLTTIATLALVAVTVRANADVQPAPVAPDSSDHMVTDGLTVEVSQSGTNVQFVPPLDGNPLTREWFHSLTAGYKATGPKAAAFAGHIAIGYLVGYPATLNGKVSFDWKTPSLNATLCPSGCGPGVGDLVPQLGAEVSVQNGPGVQSVVAAQGDVQGPEGQVRVNNLHGSVTGVMGPMRLRPYVTIQVAHGDEVTTFGQTYTS